MTGFLKFKEMVTLWVVQFLYILGVVVIALAAIAAFIKDTALEGLAVFIVGNLLWRLLCEVIVVQFRIHEALTSLDNKTPTP